jgi:hypothetical protein
MCCSSADVLSVHNVLKIIHPQTPYWALLNDLASGLCLCIASSSASHDMTCRSAKMDTQSNMSEVAYIRSPSMNKSHGMAYAVRAVHGPAHS